MRRHIEQIAFYLFYICTTLNVFCVLHPFSCMATCLATDVTFVVYAWVRFSDDDIIHMLRKFIYGELIVTMLIGGFFANSIVPFIFIGPVLLGYLRLEGGYRVVKVS